MKRRVLSLLLIVVGFAALAVILPRYVSLDVLVENETRLRSAIARHPLQAFLAGFGLYFLTSLIPGTSGKSVICGWVFGFWQALIIVDLALSAAAMVMFFVGHYALSGLVRYRFARFVEQMHWHLERDGAFYLLMARFAHVPFTLVNYSCGALKVQPRTFAWTTVCGLLPGSAIFVFAGTQLPTLREMQERGLWGLVDPGLWAALALTAVLPVAIRFAVTRWRIATGVRRDTCI